MKANRAYGSFRIFLLFMVAYSTESMAATCVEVSNTEVEICVSASFGDPLLGVDFSLTPSSLSGGINVSLHKGDLDWVLTATNSEDGSAANLGQIKLVPSSPSENFGVSIGENFVAGAHHVESMHLTARRWNGFSNINNCLLDGDFKSGLTVVSNPAGEGGELLGECAVLGSARGVYSIPRMVGGAFSVGQLFDGHLLIGESMTDSAVHLSGDVSRNSHITLRSLQGTSAASLSSEYRSFAGTLSFPDGLPEFISVTIGGYAANATVDFYHQPIGGFFSLDQGGHAQIIRGGQILSSGHVWVSNGEANTFTGYAEFLGVDQYGVIEAEYSNVDGTIVVHNDLNGTLMVRIGDTGPETQILIGGDVGPGAGLVIAGTPWFGGHFSGLINIEGTVHGWLSVAKTLFGHIRVGRVVSAIEVLGTLASGAQIIVEDTLEGSIDVGGATQIDSLIHVGGGVGRGGSILLNSQASFEPSRGDVRVGRAASREVSFDGIFYVNAPYRGGAFMGNLRVEGCHRRPTQLNFCFEGGMYGSVDLLQRSCRYKSSWSSARCP